MNVRELLRYEIWSKETSRRILRPIVKILKPTGIVLGSLVFLAVVVYAIESGWLTNGERTAGKVALVQVEKLETLIDCNCDGFAVTDENAKAAVEVARQNAWTLRDRQVAALLSFYLWEVEQAQGQDSRETKLKRLMQQRGLRWHSDPKLDKEDRSSRFQEFSSFRSALQKELN
ncbi:MAG TPA: hypothetical protein VFU55_08955 [Terracidiphilus sp.]|nr:hypothetical protein [Terracidiphilus sp.]